MRNNIYILLLLLIALFSSCEEELTPYNYSQNTLGFEYERDQYGRVADSIKRFTFAYFASSVTEDTIWIDVRTTGYVVDYDRPVNLRQIEFQDEDELEVGETALLQAEAGVHYVPFDSPELVSGYTIPAGKNQALLPLIVKRDISLKEKKRYLKLEVIENEHFSQSYIQNRAWTVELSDVLTKPKTWNGAIRYYFAGDYGKVKHQFMIDVSGKVIDEEYFYDLLNPLDMGYLQYLSSFYAGKLREENARRAELGLDPLREEPTEEGAEGKLVQFVLYGSPV